MYTVQLRSPTLRCLLLSHLLEKIDLAHIKYQDQETLITTCDCVYLVDSPRCSFLCSPNEVGDAESVRLHNTVSYHHDTVTW